jgi:hypothetical protein
MDRLAFGYRGESAGMRSQVRHTVSGRSHSSGAFVGVLVQGAFDVTTN